MPPKIQKFQNKYTIKSTRLENYDYAQNGLYFITICTKDKAYFFGEIEKEKMVLNDAGKIVQEELLQTSIIRPNVFLDQWVIMPNHLHAIIEIINPIPSAVETPRWGVLAPSNVNVPQITGKTSPIEKTEISTTRNLKMSEVAINLLPSMDPKTPQRGVSTEAGKCGGFNPNWKPNSLGSIINQFKSICTKRIWKSKPCTFAWQPRFYDYIIRNDEALNKIREYIEINPQMWQRDRNLPAGETGNLENLWM